LKSAYVAAALSALAGLIMLVLLIWNLVGRLGL